jgi:hypothetical protein
MWTTTPLLEHGSRLEVFLQLFEEAVLWPFAANCSRPTILR